MRDLLTYDQAKRIHRHAVRPYAAWQPRSRPFGAFDRQVRLFRNGNRYVLQWSYSAPVKMDFKLIAEFNRRDRERRRYIDRHGLPVPTELDVWPLIRSRADMGQVVTIHPDDTYTLHLWRSPYGNWGEQYRIMKYTPGWLLNTRLGGRVHWMFRDRHGYYEVCDDGITMDAEGNVLNRETVLTDEELRVRRTRANRRAIATRAHLDDLGGTDRLIEHVNGLALVAKVLQEPVELSGRDRTFILEPDVVHHSRFNGGEKRRIRKLILREKDSDSDPIRLPHRYDRFGGFLSDFHQHFAEWQLPSVQLHRLKLLEELDEHSPALHRLRTLGQMKEMAERHA